jgi:hypothetical protein
MMTVEREQQRGRKNPTQPTTLDEQDQAVERHCREMLTAIIGEQAMHTLGRPRHLLHVQVRWLWESYYRLNVFVGPDVTAGKVAHSYFLAADDEGNILSSTPPITRQY